MHVAIVGSYRKPSAWNMRSEDMFASFCEELGRQLGRIKKSFLIVPTDRDKDSADFHCLNGFRAAVNEDRLRWAVKDPSPLKGPGSGDPTDSGRLPRGHTDAVTSAQVVITIGGGEGTYASAMTAIRHRTLLLPIRAFGGASEMLVQKMNLAGNHFLQSAMFESFESKPQINVAVRAIIAELKGHPRIMIVHGRSNDRNEVKTILSAIKPKLHGAKILEKAGGSGMEPISQRFTDVAGACTAAIIIATPDDIGTTVMDDKGEQLKAEQIKAFQSRARENVWIELGWLWSRLGTDRVMLLLKQDTNIPSDLGGARFVKYQDSPLEAKEKIEEFIEELRSTRPSL
jgi:predicted nucleotide-binding protein